MNMHVGSEAKFKVGDRVRGKGFSVPHTGKMVEGVITDAYVRDRIGILIEMDNGDKTWIYSNCVSLVTPNNHAIVCLIEDGQPKPATHPFVHPSTEAATKEAAMLAGVHKGQEFGVYELIAKRRVEKTYEHEWQRLAADKMVAPWRRKKLAADALTKASGIPIFSAEKAVDDWLMRAA